MSGLPSVSKNHFDFIFFFAVYKVWWWSEEVRLVFQCFLISHEKGGMEDGVNLPPRGNAEAEGYV